MWFNKQICILLITLIIKLAAADSRSLKNLWFFSHKWWPFGEKEASSTLPHHRNEYASARQANLIIASTTSTITKRSEQHDWVCLGVANGFRCADCKHNVMCIGGEAFTQICSHGTACAIKPQFANAVCHAEIPANCLCPNSNQIQADPYSPFVYQLCDEAGEPPYKIEKCPDGYLFQNSSTCEPKPDFPPCNALGTFPNEKNCDWYYSCHLNGVGSWTQIHRKCPHPGYAYSTSHGKCVNANILSPSEPCARKSNRKSRYICSLWGLLVAKIFPSFIHKLCYEFD